MIALRRDETPEWARWTNARYEPVPVKHRTGTHLALPGVPWTLCMRTPDRGAPLDRGRLCPACRGGAKVAYAMRGGA